MASGVLSAASKKHLPQSYIFHSAIACGLLLMAVSYISFQPLALLVFGILGFTVIIFMVNCNTAIQLASPKDCLGRIMGLYTFVFLGSAPFGSLLVSTIIEYLGTSAGLLVTGLLEILLIVLYTRPDQQ